MIQFDAEQGRDAKSEAEYIDKRSEGRVRGRIIC